MLLRPYQTAALDRVAGSWREGARSLVLVMPTGAGKTKTAVEACLRAVSRGRRVLWLAHRRELLKQASDRITADGLPGHALVLAGAVQGDPSAPVVVASVDTLRARNYRPPADLIIWDECQHCKATSWEEIQRSYPAAYHLGLTATPQRGDGRALGDLFQAIVVGATVAELTDAGYLVPATVIAPARAMPPGALAQEPLDAWASQGGLGKALLYADSVAQAETYAREASARGIPAAALSGATPTPERDRILAQFKAGVLRLVSNVAVLTEGYDCPDADVCLLARHVGHAGLYLQIVGRVLRAAPGKTRALVLDLAGNVYAHGLPEDEREYSLDGRGIESKATVALSVCRGCGAAGRGYPCLRCGYLPEAKQLEILREAIAPYVPPQVADTPTARRLVLERLVRTATERGYRVGWVYHAWKQRFNGPLPSGEYQRLSQRLKGNLTNGEDSRGDPGSGDPNQDPQRTGTLL